MKKPSYCPRALQILVDIDTSTQIPVVQLPLTVKADHDIREAYISMEETGIRECRRTRYVVNVSIMVQVGPNQPSPFNESKTTKTRCFEFMKSERGRHISAWTNR